MTEFNAPVAGNGRGIAVVGNTVYYSNADTGKIYITNLTSHTDDGVFVDTGFGSNGIATVAYDGTNIYATGYTGNNTTNVYDLRGKLVRTVSGLGNGRDGSEVANSNIVANRGDGIGSYDLYDLSGKLIQSDFLVDPNVPVGTFGDTGVTFDGSNCYVSEIELGKIVKFDASGRYLGVVATLSGNHSLEDLSALGNVPGNPPSNPPSTASYTIAGTDANTSRTRCPGIPPTPSP